MLNYPPGMLNSNVLGTVEALESGTMAAPRMHTPIPQYPGFCTVVERAGVVGMTRGEDEMKANRKRTGEKEPGPAGVPGKGLGSEDR